jgi:signal transduction histidine kinase
MMQIAGSLVNRVTSDLPANDRVAEECGTDMAAVRAFMEKRGIIKQLTLIHDSGIRAAMIVKDMLSFARKGDTQPRHENLGELLDKTVELASRDYDLKKQYDFRKIEIIREYEPEMPPVLCEAGKMQQVFLNLLRNSAEAMNEWKGTGELQQGKAPRIVLRIVKEADMARIEIEDNGPGIDEAVRKRVFEPFFTTKGLGTGLGLSVSYFIVCENHGGTLHAESFSGKGTKFIIRLPLQRTQA